MGFDTMSWKNIIKRGQKRRKRKLPEPFNPFTGEGRDINEKPKTYQDYLTGKKPHLVEEESEHEEKVKESEKTKRLPASRVSQDKGGRARNFKFNRMRSPKSRCAMCSKYLSRDQRFEMPSPDDLDTILTYCKDCVDFREGKTAGPSKVKERTPKKQGSGRWKKQTRG